MRTMTERKPDAKEEKAARLARKLRENLKRRRRPDAGGKRRAIKNDEKH
ncbi:hypothetical protein [Minwuia thermotolerans]|jgi:hypothetical protein|nr:hypothetical protein [Minwuia thermotolerans]